MTKKKTKVVEEVVVVEEVEEVEEVVEEVVSKTVERDPILDSRIIQVRVYQAVTFNGNSETTFITEGIQRKAPVSARIIPELFSVLIENELDQVLVPMTNVSGIYYENARYRKKKAAEEAEEDKKSAIRATLTDNTVKPK